MQHVAGKAGSFNMKVKYYKRTQLPAEEEAKLGLTYCSSLDELLACADVLSLHCPLNKETTGLIGKEQFAKMKDGVFLVNTCRGPIIDESALIEALESGKVTRAGLDVFHNEPNIK
jgi:lactate dehydrogenase-like 2-hydroxyacid dehydrogenase